MNALNVPDSVCWERVWEFAVSKIAASSWLCGNISLDILQIDCEEAAMERLSND